MGMYAGLAIVAKISPELIRVIDDLHTALYELDDREVAISYLSNKDGCTYAGFSKIEDIGEDDPCIPTRKQDGFVYTITTGCRSKWAPLIRQVLDENECPYIMYAEEDSYFGTRDIENLFTNNVEFAKEHMSKIEQYLPQPVEIESPGRYAYIRNDHCSSFGYSTENYWSHYGE